MAYYTLYKGVVERAHADGDTFVTINHRPLTAKGVMGAKQGGLVSPSLNPILSIPAPFVPIPLGLATLPQMNSIFRGERDTPFSDI